MHRKSRDPSPENSRDDLMMSPARAGGRAVGTGPASAGRTASGDIRQAQSICCGPV
ncbi:MAG: hypothetical protein WBN94_06130 [Methanothrix sp.]